MFCHGGISNVSVSCLLTLALFLSFSSPAACLRSEQPQSASVQEEEIITTPLPSNVRVENCTNNETMLQACINGECVVRVNIDTGSRLSECLCDVNYTGLRCHRRKPRWPTIGGGSTAQAGVIAAAVVGTVVVLIVVAVVFIVCKLKSRQEQRNRMLANQRANNNGVMDTSLTNGANGAHGRDHTSPQSRESEEERLLEMKAINNNTMAPA